MKAASAAVVVEAERMPAGMIDSLPAMFASAVTTFELKETGIGVEAEAVVAAAAQAADADLSWRREHLEVSYY